MSVETIITIIRESLDAAIRNEQSAIDMHNRSADEDTIYGAYLMQQRSVAQKVALQGVLDEIGACV